MQTTPKLSNQKERKSNLHSLCSHDSTTLYSLESRMKYLASDSNIFSIQSNHPVSGWAPDWELFLWNLLHLNRHNGSLTQNGKEKKRFSCSISLVCWNEGLLWFCEVMQTQTEETTNCCRNPALKTWNLKILLSSPSKGALKNHWTTAQQEVCGIWTEYLQATNLAFVCCHANMLVLQEHLEFHLIYVLMRSSGHSCFPAEPKASK